MHDRHCCRWPSDGRSIGCAFGNRTGNNTGRAAFTVQLYLHVGNSMLSVMGHQFLCDIKFGIWSEFNEGFTLGRVHTFDLGGLQGENRILTHINLCYRVENLAAGAVSFSVVDSRHTSHWHFCRHGKYEYHRDGFRCILHRGYRSRQRW